MPRSSRDRILDDLYAGPPARFLAARADAVARLRAAGKTREAARVAKLRKPTTDADILNRLARAAPELVARLAGASRALAAGQKRATRRRGADAADLRRAMEEARGVLEELLDRAAELGAKSHMPRIAAALRAALGDPEVAAALAEGHLERAPEAAAAFAPSAP
jgi:hypothetical protein